MDEWGRPTTVAELEVLIAKVAVADDVYAVAREVWRGALVVAGSSRSEVAHDLWLLWGGLTDSAEGRPDEAVEAQKVMRRAATEWRSVKEDAVARDRYFEHWLYGVMGYERPDE